MNDTLFTADPGLILAIVSAIVAIAGLALNFWKTFSSNTASATGAVAKSLATILGATPTAAEVGAFIMLAKETVGSPLIGGGLFASLIELTAIGFGLWILTGDASIDGVPINKGWGFVFIGIGLFYMFNATKRKTAVATTTQRMVSATVIPPQ